MRLHKEDFMKKLISLLLVLAMLFCIVGCTSDTDTNKKDDSTKAPANSTPAPTDGTALTVGEHAISGAILSYFYMDSVTEFCSQFSSYGDLADLYLQLYAGLSLTTALNQQYYDKEAGKTWADYFVESAVENATWTYAMYDAALAAQYTLPEDVQKELDAFPTTLQTYATYMGYQDVNTYLQSIYGENAHVDSYIEYYRMAWVAAEYAEQHYNDLTFTLDEIDAYEVGKEVNYNSYSFATYYISVSKYMQHLFGKQDTYTDEQKNQAQREANALAEELASKATSVSALDLAILQANLDSKLFATSCVEAKYTLYSSIGNEEVRNWLTEDDRYWCDAGVVSNKVDDTVDGYYVVLLNSVDDTKTPLANVPHILVLAKTDEEFDAAWEKAEQILAEFQSSEAQDSATFGELAKQYSEDGGSKNNGGLYENICRNHYYVESFENWAVAGHEPGDTGIVETEYGVHIMYYKEHGAMTYRQYMIESELRIDEQLRWEDEIVDAVTATLHDTSCLAMDLVING